MQVSLSPVISGFTKSSSFMIFSFPLMKPHTGPLKGKLINLNNIENVILSYRYCMWERVGSRTFLLLLLFFILVCFHFLVGGEKKKSLNNMKIKMTQKTHNSEANLLFRAWRIRDGYIKCRVEGREIRDAQFLLLKQRAMWVLDAEMVSNSTTNTANTNPTVIPPDCIADMCHIITLPSTTLLSSGLWLVKKVLINSPEQQLW